MGRRNPKLIAKSFQKKGMVKNVKRNHITFHKRMDGVTTVFTQISHNSKEIGDQLANYMAKDCYLSLKEFWSLIECPLSEAEWEKLIKVRSVR